MKKGLRYREGRFRNFLPEAPMSMARAVVARIRASHTEPEPPLQPLVVEPKSFETPPESGLRITWFGHSSLLVEIDGARLLIDPVWGDRASPLQWAGPKRWYAPPLAIEDLPELDAVIISHDHYDHLCMPTVEALRERVRRWVMPLGVGAHLEHWGVPAERIEEYDWWEHATAGQVQLHCTPARHFSGRSGLDRNATLWSGWALVGPEHRVFYSGDTALHPELRDIGERLGPFDLTLIETGAYSPIWRDVHIGPEQAVIAHQMVRGQHMFPVHWGLFDLANHSWTEPAERVRAEAEARDVSLLLAPPGAQFEPTREAPRDVWWPRDVPWSPASESPQWSSGVESLLPEHAREAPEDGSDGRLPST